ncbi:DUF421 domain-containing protein [Latilactobacillus graminis]|uniref:DUF421 domain-containing protein n=2 Tax=Latilactobacillus graminis TaxID=60519 RepID=A0AA89L4Q5_9LACO|nr:YetF domain-containing protein [Latilactobacillus graminis]KRM24272.1 hypothetical protein FC90_GL000749 [Latilactobacillus graminis DSM 20719]QFP78750.1 DUF421 domain-containing protein [Latilactobacillus graminis]
MPSYFDITIKLIFGFFCLVLQINLSGKGNLAPSSGIDQLQNYVLGGIVGGMIYSVDVSLLQFLLVLLIWTLIVFTMKFLTTHNRWIKRWVVGNPQTIITNGHIDVQTAAKNSLSAQDLSFKLRIAGINDIRTVSRAILEQNGQLTITQKGDATIKYPLIMDGQINSEALELIDHSDEWLLANIAQQGYSLQQIYMANYLNHKIVITPY